MGVKRPGYGTGGRVVDTTVNAFDLCIPDGIIYHYDGQYMCSFSLTFTKLAHSDY